MKNKIFQRAESRRFSSKKAQFELRKSIYWTIAGIVITIVVIAFAFVLASYNNKLTYIPAELKSELISLRFVNNPDCFAYQENGRVFSGVIDLAKFTEANLLDCYKTDKNKGYKDYNFRLVLKNEKKEIQTNEYYNVDKHKIYKEVLVKDGETFQKDLLVIYVYGRI